MIRLERTTGHKRLGWVSLVGVLLVPIVMAAGFLAATWDSTSRWGKVQAAIVNNDDPVKVEGQTVPLGRQLAGGLVQGGDDGDTEQPVDNFDWVISDADDAADGLADGRYAAVITIGSDFSADATSYSHNDGGKAEQATIDVQTSKVSGVTDSAVAEAISSTAVSTLNDQLSQQYLQNLYVGFNQSQQGMQRSANGASDLSGGATKLTKGINQSSTGAGELADGLDQLSSGASELSDGLHQTDTGAEELSSGASELARGVRQTDQGVEELDRGVGKLDRGATDYRKGVQKFGNGLSDYTDGVQQYADGVGPFASGVSEYAGGVKKYVNGANQLAGGVPEYTQGVDSYVDGVGSYVQGVDQYTGGVGDYVDGVDQYANGVTEFVGGVGPAANQVANQVSQQSDDLCEQQQLDAQQCQLFSAGVKAGAQGTATGVKQALVDSGSSSNPAPGQQLISSSKQLTKSGDKLANSTDKISNSTEKLGSGGEKLSTSGKKLRTGAQQLSQPGKQLAKSSTKIAGGADQLANSGDQLTAAGGKLNDGADGLVSGAKQLESGISDLHDGSGQLADGTGKLATGAGELSDGTSELSTGIGELADGGDQLASGVDQSATGADKLSSGLDRLHTGGKQLAGGAGDLADGLQQAADKLPTYSKSDRTQLSEVASQPVSSDGSDQLFANETTTTLLMALALWIGGLATYLVVRAVGSDAFGSGRSTARLALEGVVPGVAIGAVQALALSGMLAVLLDLGAAGFSGLLAFGLLASTAFAVVNHALVAWLGGIGRFISLTVAVLAAAGAITGALPDFFAAVRPFLPITPALEGIRMIVTDGPSPGSQVGALLGWLVVGAAASVIAVARHRMARVRPADT